MAKTRVATAAIEFTAEDAKFLASLRNLQRENKTLGSSFQQLGREAQSVFGTGLEQKATQAVTAIKAVGGATKLTDDEAKRHLRTLDQWIAKSKALGKDVPDSILSTRAALANVNTEAGKAPGLFSTIGGSAMKMAGVMGIAFSAGAVISFTKSIVSAAGDIIDLSNKTGLTTDSIQRMQHAANLTGAELSNFTDAAFKLGVNLSGGGKGVVGAVQALGLEYEKLRAMSPDQQFELIAEKLGQVENAQDRNRLAVELFGKGAAAILPAIAENYKKLGDKANVAGREQLDALDEAADAWDEFYERQTKNIMGWLGTRVMVFNQLQRLSDSERARLEEDFTNPGGSITPEGEKYLLRLARRKDIALPAPAGADTGISIDYIAELAKAREEVEKLTAAQRAGIEAAQAMGASTEEITRQYHVSEAALRVLNDTQKGAAKALKDSAAALRLYAHEQKNAADVEKKWADAKIVMAKITHKLQEDTTKALVDEQQRRLDATNTAMQHEAQTLATFQEKNLQSLLTGSALRMRQIEVEEKAVIASLKTQGFWHQEAAKQVKTYYDQLRLQATLPLVGTAMPLPQPPPVPADWGQSLRQGLKAHAKTLGQDVSNTLAQNIASGDWSQFENQMSASFSKFMGASIATGISMIPGMGTIGPMLEPILTAISDKILGAFGLGTKGRDLVKEFAASFGGFDALHKELNKLGAEGERLWIALTQGVGRNNPEQALAAIQRIQDALENIPLTMQQKADAAGFQTTAELQAIADEAVELWEFMSASGEYSAAAVQEAWQRAQDALAAAGDESVLSMQKAQAEIKTLQDELNSFADALRAEQEAPEYDEVTGERIYGVIEKEQMARKAAIEEEIRLKQEAIDAEIAAREEADRIEAENAGSASKLRREEYENEYEYIQALFGRGIKIPAEFIYSNAPGSGFVPTSHANRGGLVHEMGVRYLAAGGSIFKPRGTDTVPAMLTPGEFVLNTRAVDLIGADVLSGLNSGRDMVAPRAVGSGASASNVAPSKPVTVNVSVDARGANFPDRDSVDRMAKKTAEAILRGGEVYDSWRHALSFIDPHVRRGPLGRMG